MGPLIRKIVLMAAIGAWLAAASPAMALDPSVANFQGNRTVITGPPGKAIVLQRQGDCSLSYSYGDITLSLASPALQLTHTTDGYQNVLHRAAGLTSTGDAFPNGCANSPLGIGSRRGFYLGTTTQNLYMFAAYGYDVATDGNVLYYATIDPATQALKNLSIDASQPNIDAVAAGDLNGDGLADIVGLDQAAGSIMVWLAKDDGSVGAPTPYTVPGDTTTAAVLDDFNGDGKVDVVVAAFDRGSSQDQISILTGKGDGTLNAPQSFSVSAPTANYAPQRVQDMVAVDLRGTGRPDIVCSNGIVLLNNGDGTFTEGTPAFPARDSSSGWGPNLAAGDFNGDGKADVALDDGYTISLYLGSGDGTFTAGKAYASNDSVGYLSAADLDGDGNLDLYVGLGNGGFFLGDQWDVGQGYALMGNGDGTFQGMPVLPFVYTGQNMADLNGDGILDAVGLNSADLSFTSYLGGPNGAFKAHKTLTTTPITINGNPLTILEMDSYALGDINGDGIPDLGFIAKVYNGPANGLLLALGDGNGGFGTPFLYQEPSFVPAGDFDLNPTLSNLHFADFNQDGKADVVYNYTDTSSNTGTYYVGTVVQLGNGDGTFQAPQIIPFYSGPSTTDFFLTSKVQQIADLNRDGYPDLIFITETATMDSSLSTYIARIQVALGHGDGTFSTPTPIAGPDIMVQSYSDTGPAPIQVADMNGDGIPDIVALGASSTHGAQISVSLGNGDGTFKSPILKNFAGQYLGGKQNIAVADFNGDGKLDVAYFASIIGSSGIFLGNGDGTLQSASIGGAVVPNLTINLPVGGGGLALDLNGDGKQDVIAGSTELLSQAASNPVPDFSASLSSSAGTVTAGASVKTTVTLSPSNGFSGTVSLSCSGLPQGATCGFVPPSLDLNGAAASATMTISTTAAAATPASAGWPPDPRFPGALLLAVVGIPLLMRRRSTFEGLRRGMLALLLIVSVLALQSCGGGGSGGGGSTGTGAAATPAGSYKVTLTAASATETHTIPYTLRVTSN